VIAPEDQERIVNATREFWHEEVKIAAFRAIFAGKEIGHRIADYVDERTTEMLEAAFTTGHELDGGGIKRARSMGDIWFLSCGIFNPINVKAGEAGKNGQPNLVSLNKLIDALLRGHIDSYYLLIVKMKYGAEKTGHMLDEQEARTIEPQVYLVDMLDYLDFVNFDAGPGQAMLREQEFYSFVDDGQRSPERELKQKVRILVELLEDGHRRLHVNRQRRLAEVRQKVEEYEQRAAYQICQDGLNVG
jgi:hypothetical protein